MAMRVLPPGFRFHPTDVELLKYYLKRKILGRPFFEAIQEVSIYKLDPWDLPGLSCLKSDDQKWYFFSPRERRYGHGERAKRSTEGGFWKTTGRDRPVMYNDETVGMIKTLIFHEGRAPNGSRTDWVMHEYRLEDRDLAAKGIPQDSYVVCAIFKKKGPGPRNGAQYGAFREEDWEDDEVSAVLPSDLLLAARGSELAYVPLQEEQLDQYARNQAEANTGLSESITVVGTPPPLVSASETVLPELSEAGPSTSSAGINHACEAGLEDILIDPNTDGMEVEELLAMFDTSVDNNIQDILQTATAGPDGGGGTLAAPAAEGYAIFDGLPDLDVDHYGTWSCTNRFGFDSSHYFPSTAGFVELIDLGQNSAEATTYPANLQGSEINTRNAGDRSPDEWRRLG